MLYASTHIAAQFKRIGPMIQGATIMWGRANEFQGSVPMKRCQLLARRAYKGHQTAL